MSGARGPLSKDTALPAIRDDSSIPPAPTRVDALAWQALWSSEVSLAWDPGVDGIVVERYLDVLQRWFTAREQLDRLTSPVTTGSQGQPVLHPITRYIDSLESRMAQLEKELGLTPMARARLGLTIGTAQLTAEQINKMARG